MPKAAKPLAAKKKPHAVSAVIFDGDDTLWETQTLYDQAKKAFADLMVKEGFNAKQALLLMTEIDLQNVRRWGFSRHRFPRSLVATYESLAKNAGRSAKPKVRQRVEALGQSVFERRPQLIAGARPLLERLQGKVRLVLMTAGDRTIQRQRIETSGLRAFFDVIDIPKIKTQAEFRRLVKRLKVQPSETWMIGNSMRSDIIPAHKVGLQTVWVSGRGWAYDYGTEEGQPVTKAPNLTKVRDILRRNMLGL